MTEFVIRRLTVKLFLVTIILGIGVRLAAQDLLVFTDGSIEQVKVLEVGDDAIKYKKWTNLEGPTFSTSKANVFSIKYQDGSEEKMVNQPVVRPVAPNQSYQPARQKTGGGGYPQTLDGGFSIHFGGAFPVGDFGSETKLSDGDIVFPNLDKGFSAGPGFNVGIKGKIPLPANGLGVIISGDFIFNGIKGTLKDDYDELQEIIEDYDGSFTRSRYINVPVMVGLNYKYSVNQHFGVWAETGIGANLRMITATKIEFSGYDSYTETYKFPIRTCFAFQIGGGIMINDLFSVGLHYYGLGSAKLKLKYEYEDDWDSYSFTDTTTKSYSQGCFMVRLGFHF